MARLCQRAPQEFALAGFPSAIQAFDDEESAAWVIVSGHGSCLELFAWQQPVNS